MVAAKIINGSVTGLRFARELPGQIGVQDPAAPWFEYEPNTHGDWGASIRTVAREVISQDRQMKKGSPVEQDAAGGFVSDLTQHGLREIMPGFMFAEYRSKAEATTLTGTTATDYEGTGMGGFVAGRLVVARGFALGANNGLREVTASSGTTVTTTPSPVAEAVAPVDAKLSEVGVQAGTGDIGVDASGAFPVLTSSALDFTTLGLVEGEWIRTGGDAAGTSFSNAANNTFAQILSITANALTLIKARTLMVTEAGGGLDIQIFYGSRVLKNETGNAGSGQEITRITYQGERTLGAPETSLPTEIQSEYLEGAVCNTMEIQIGASDKVVVDMGFVALDASQRTGAEGVKAGSRPSIADASAFNTSSHFPMLRLTPVDDTTGTPLPLFGELLNVTLNLNNNCKPAKAIGSLEAIEIIVGRFMVSGEVEAYFSDVTAIGAIKANRSVSLDMAIVADNAGVIFDIPLLTLGEGRLNIQQDEAITIPVSYSAASGAQVNPALDYTLMQCWFDYLPTAAE